MDHLLDIDSYGCLFMYATHKDLTTSPRHLVHLKEPVNPALLQKAVELALIRFPQMALGLKRGEKSYSYRYLDKPPVVLPCQEISNYYMGSDDTNGYLFLCGYNGNTIYLEYHHCTSDGHGFDEFIRSILFEYFTLCGYDIKNDGSIRTRETEFSLEESQDAYPELEQLHPSSENHYPDGDAFHMPEYDSSEDADELVTEITMPFAKVQEFNKANGATPMTFLMTAVSMGMYRTYYVGTDHKEPIVAEVPMDLRQYIPTKTIRFFLSLLDLPFQYEYFALPFAEASRKCREYFDTQKAAPHAAYWAMTNAKRVAEGHAADMPVAEKEKMMRDQARAYIRRDSFILTNIGPFSVPACMEEHIEDYAAILPCAFQPFGVLVSSYKGILKVTLSQRDGNRALASHIVDVLGEIGIEAKTKSYPYHPTKYDGLRLAK